MTRILNRFGELSDELRRGYSQEAIGIKTRLRTREAFGSLYDFLRFYAPKGDASDPYGRPSLRLHGKTLFDSWVPVEYSDPPSGFAGARVSIELDHPTVQEGRRDILDWLITGTKPHMVGADKFLSGGGGPRIRYHWGSPLLWPPKDGLPAGVRFAFFAGDSKEMRSRGYWAQPIQPNFLDLAEQRAEPRIVAAFGDVGTEVAFGPMERSDFLTRK